MLYLFRDKQSSMVKDAFACIKNKGTFLLLQRFFAKNINFSNGINHEVLFAIKNSAKTKNPHLNQLVQFWNISYCSEEPDALEVDKPDREPFCRFDLQNVTTKAQREHLALLSCNGVYNPRDPFMGQVSDIGVPYSRHKEMIHRTFSGKKPDQTSPYTASGMKKADSRNDPSTMLKTGNSAHKNMPESRNNNDINPMSNLADFEKFRSSFDTFSGNKANKTHAYDQAYRESMNLSNYLDNKNKDGDGNQGRDRNMFSMQN